MIKISTEAYKNYLRQNYKHKFQPIEKTVEEIIEELSEKIDLIEVDIALEASHFVYASMANFENSIRNSEMGLRKNEFDLVVYEITQNNKSKNYYYEVVNCFRDKIIVIIEKRTQSISSNCEKLNLELLIEQGIDRKHFDNDTPELFAYLMLLDTYAKQEY